MSEGQSNMSWNKKQKPTTTKMWNNSPEESYKWKIRALKTRFQSTGFNRLDENRIKYLQLR